LIASRRPSPWRWRIVSLCLSVAIAAALGEGLFRTAGTWWLASRVAPDEDRVIAGSPGTDGWPIVRQDGEPIGFVPGSAIDVRHPELFMLGRRSAIVGIAKRLEQTYFDRYTTVDLLHVVRAENLPPDTPFNGAPSAPATPE